MAWSEAARAAALEMRMRRKAGQPYKRDFSISATGDAVVGDHVKFERATFTGSFRNAKFAGNEIVQGKIIKDSYGADKQQHTFTLRTRSGVIRIKGRNLYANGVQRKQWANESLRKMAVDEKHSRGDAARTMRDIRKLSSGKY